jgi:hypothetical protein
MLLTVLDVLLPVEEPVWDLVLPGVLHDGDDLLDLLLAELSRALAEVDVGLLEDDVCVTATDSLDGGHGEHDVALPVNVRVHHTQDVLEVGRDHERHPEAVGGKGKGRKGLKHKWEDKLLRRRTTTRAPATIYDAMYADSARVQNGSDFEPKIAKCANLLFLGFTSHKAKRAEARKMTRIQEEITKFN